MRSMASDAKKKPRGPVLRVLTRLVTNGVNLAALGSAAVGAAAMHSAPILALGGLAYAALVAWDMASPAFWKKAVAKPRRELPDPHKLCDAAVRELATQILRAREEIDRVLSDTPDDVRSHLEPVMASVSAMQEGAVQLIERVEDLTRYLATASPDGVRLEIDRLAAKATSARDEGTRKEYESARTARQDQLRALEEIAGATERAMANLTRIVATLEGLPPKVVHMRALDAQAMDALSGSMSDEIQRINTDMLAFEETLKSLGEISPI